MANVNPSEPYIKIAHSVQEQMMVSQFTEQQRRILDLIYRLSLACGKTTAYIPRQKDFELVGVREFHVKAHLDALVRDKVISREGSYYGFNLNFNEWRVSRAFNYSPEKIQELVHLNLSMPDQSQLTENVSNPAKLTESVSQNDTENYVLRKSAVPSVASPKDSIPQTIKENVYKSNSVIVEGLLEIFSRLSGWGFDKVADSLWAADFLGDYPETQLSEIKACTEYHSKSPADKGAWKCRMRRWMKNEREWHKEKGDGNGKRNKDTGQGGKERVAGSRPKEDYEPGKPWYGPK